MIDNSRIEVGFHKLMDDAVHSTAQYVRALQNEFPDFPPDVIATLALASAIDFHGGTVGLKLQEIGDNMADLAVAVGGLGQ